MNFYLKSDLGGQAKHYMILSWLAKSNWCHKIRWCNWCI